MRRLFCDRSVFSDRCEGEIKEGSVYYAVTTNDIHGGRADGSGEFCADCFPSILKLITDRLCGPSTDVVAIVVRVYPVRY